MRKPVNQHELRPKPEKCPVIPLAWSVEEFAQATGIGRTTVFQLIKEGQIKPFKIGKRTLIAVKEAEAFIARMSGDAA